MIDRRALLMDLRPQVHKLEDDLRTQVAERHDVYERLRVEYTEALKLGRTSATWETWRDEHVTQVAAAWVLGTVFVRFCEDNGLLARPFLAGPTPERMTAAAEAQGQFFRDHPDETDRGWLLAAFAAIDSALQSATTGVSLFSERYNQLYQIPVSHDAAKSLIAFWRRHSERGELVRDLTDPDWDTGFLGDLYQDLSEAARKAYALLQTPGFVAEFILDLTLTPAIEEFGLGEVKLIDPACGSGNFLLGAFHRLLEEWENHAPTKDVDERVRRALEAVHGVDINPFAVAITRFRLLVAATKAMGTRAFAGTEIPLLPFNLAVGDSLIREHRPVLFEDTQSQSIGIPGKTEDLRELPWMLEQGRYHVVVGNPPYTTVKDKTLDGLYRALYSDVCTGRYALSVPFTQRMFELARRPDADGRGAGYVGEITANSFMKREFGRPLIEKFFAQRVNLTHLIDTSGAFIPGHGTPTIILIGRNRPPVETEKVLAVTGLHGEPEVPAIPERGLVWESILRQAHQANQQDAWTQSLSIDRARLMSFPWNLADEQATEVLDTMLSGRKLGESVARIGYSANTGADGVFIAPPPSFRRLRVENSNALVAIITGSEVRDWTAIPELEGFFPRNPRDRNLEPVDIKQYPCHLRRLWPYRTLLGKRSNYSGRTYFEDGRRWYDWHHVTQATGTQPWSIAFAWVATHNHFALLRGHVVPLPSAPVIKLPDTATQQDHVELVALLNSSAVCFWLKQHSNSKGRPTVDQTGSGEPWTEIYEFTATRLGELPLPEVLSTKYAVEFDRLAETAAALTPAAVLANGVPAHERLATARSHWEAARSRMVSLQEELDWEIYGRYGLLSEELTATPESVPGLQSGERAFEIVLARKMAAGEVESLWFARHSSNPITELPAHWHEDYKRLVEKRIAVIENNQSLALIERPECKRRWVAESWDHLQERALRAWILDRCETRDLWYRKQDGVMKPQPMRATRLAHELQHDPDVVAAAELYAPGKDFTKLIQGLVADEHVPYLAALRYNDFGLEKRMKWEHVWELQRHEDTAEAADLRTRIRAQTPVPPNYRSSDFRKPSYWRHRGKLDMPKERFISYPDANRAGDSSLLLGWAGWDYREQAQALAGLIDERCDDDGWSADRLVPLLAGLREVLPWVWQWHGEFDSSYGSSPAQCYQGFLHRLNLSEEMLARWRPPKSRRGRPRKGQVPPT